MKARRKNFPGKTVPVLKRSAKIYSRRCIPLSCGSETRTRFSSGNRLYNKPILDSVLRDDRYAELKSLCESREYPAYNAAAAFCRSLRQSMSEITLEIPQRQFQPVIHKLTEQEQALTVELDRLLSDAAGGPILKLLYLYNRIFRKASQIANLRQKVQEGAVRYIRAVVAHIGSALDAALEAARQTSSILQAWGDGSGEMKNTPANRELLNYVRNSEMLQKIAAYLGRYREILAAKRQNSFAYGRGEKYDIGFGSDIPFLPVLGAGAAGRPGNGSAVYAPVPAEKAHAVPETGGAYQRRGGHDCPAR